MQVEVLALEPRRDHVALELLHGEHQDERDQRVLGRVRDERDEDSQDAADERTEDRYVRADEGDHGQRDRQRHPDDRQAGADDHRVNERDDRLRPDEPAEGGPRAGEQLGGVPAGALAAELGHPRQEPVAVLDEVEAQHQHEHDVDDGGGGGAEGREDARADGLRTFLQLLLDCRDGLGDLPVGETQRTVGEPVTDGLQSGRCALREFGRLAGDLGREDGHESGEGGQEAQHHEGGGQCRGDLVTAQPGGPRLQDGRDDHREHGGEDHHPQPADRPAEDEHPGGDEHQAQAPTL